MIDIYYDTCTLHTFTYVKVNWVDLIFLFTLIGQWSQYDENTRTHSWKISCNANLKMFQGQNKIIIFSRVWLYAEETQIIHACRPTAKPMKKEIGSDSSIIVSGLKT